MGNSASEIVTRVSSLNNENLAQNNSQDAELLEDPALVFNTSKLLCRTDLDPYIVPGSESLRAKEDDMGNQDEEAMVCSLNNLDRLKEKHGDATKALLEDILRKRGDDPNSREMTLRLQGLCRIFEALIRMNERSKRILNDDKKIEQNVTNNLPPLVKATLKFGLNTILRIVKTMGKIKPDVYKFMISHTCDVLSDVEPLSLKTDDVSINSSFEKIVGFLESVLKGDIIDVKEEDRYSSISALLAIALATGNLSSILALALQFLKITNSPGNSLMIKSLFPFLKSFNELINFTEYMDWDPEKCSGNLKISTDKLSISCVNNSNRSVCLSSQIISSGLHYFEVRVDTYNENAFFGIADSSYNSLNSYYDSNIITIAYQANGVIYKQSGEIGKNEQ